MQLKDEQGNEEFPEWKGCIYLEYTNRVRCLPLTFDKLEVSSINSNCSDSSDCYKLYMCACLCIVCLQYVLFILNLVHLSKQHAFHSDNCGIQTLLPPCKGSGCSKCLDLPIHPLLFIIIKFIKKR